MKEELTKFEDLSVLSNKISLYTRSCTSDLGLSLATGDGLNRSGERENS